MVRDESVKSEMLDKIRSGGAWFSTRENKYVKIGYSKQDDCLYARECFLEEGTLEGGAYTFGMDWFDIYFHGKYIDIYANAETFRQWDVWYDREKGTCFDADEEHRDQAVRLARFCSQADAEALAGIEGAYRITSTNFDKIIELSE